MRKKLLKFLYNPFKNRLLKLFLKTEYNTKRFEIEKGKKCLCLAPHPDDETIGMGGTILKYAPQFDVICLTNGCYGIENLSKNKIIETRTQEFISAMNFAGVNNYKILDVDDKHLIDGYQEFVKINFSNYDYIFIPNYVDQHRDHKAVSIHLYNLINSNINNLKKEVTVILYEVWSPLTFANKCIDISDNIKSKKEMLQLHSSQMNEKPYFEATVGLAQYRGLLKNLDYAEAFYAMSTKEFKETIKYLYEDLIE